MSLTARATRFRKPEAGPCAGGGDAGHLPGMGECRRSRRNPGISRADRRRGSESPRPYAGDRHDSDVARGNHRARPAFGSGADDWEAARVAAETAIARGNGGQAYHDLAVALFWLNDLDPALRAMGQAHTHFRREGEPGRAAWAALWLAGHYLRLKANPAVASGWIARCERLVQESHPCAEVGRVLLMRSLASNDPAKIADAAERAVGIARKFDDGDYEALALAYWGQALVSMGHLEEGRAKLDDAMVATAAGEVHAPEAVGQIYCALLTGCEQTVDFERARQWRHVAQPFLEKYDHVGVTGTCRATYAKVLAAVGEWQQAETELLHAVETFNSWAPGMRADALVRLAELRLRQGRLADATILLEGNQGHPDAQVPQAELELARGRAGVAIGLLERRLRQVGQTNLQAAPVLVRMVDARLAAGDQEGAREAARALQLLAEAANGDCLRGLAALALGCVKDATREDPVAEFEAAVQHLEKARMPWEAAMAHIHLAECLATAANREMAVREAGVALETFTALGAAPGIDRARRLLRLMGSRTPSGPRAKAKLTRREQEIARLVCLGLSNQQIAARLFLSTRTVEHHVSAILRKLDAGGRAEVAAYAARHLQAV